MNIRSFIPIPVVCFVFRVRFFAYSRRVRAHFPPRMLEDTSFADVVSWGPQGDCFVVKDMNEFTKSILPRMFKHSNFASFVRQLNKYDFHKVRLRSLLSSV